MPIVIVSDVHANLAALRAVLADAAARGAVAAIWATGDLVGYGAEPAEVPALLREHHLVAVAGNHDLAACGKIGVEEFNASAAAAARWTTGRLNAHEREWLAALSQTRVESDFTLAHGSLRDPVWEYLLSGEQALVQFELQTTPYSIVGHSHLPFVFEERPDGVPRSRRVADGQQTTLGSTRLIINPGSVGQPRDGDPRASYVLYDESAALLTWHRVEYDIATTQQKIIAAGLPHWLADRLSAGT
jgi:diadenosine tetraphosphatase ApaH/serine/threonine PP2A family protein phosphatase